MKLRSARVLYYPSRYFLGLVTTDFPPLVAIWWAECTKLLSVAMVVMANLARITMSWMMRSVFGLIHAWLSLVSPYVAGNNGMPAYVLTRSTAATCLWLDGLISMAYITSTLGRYK